METELNWIGVPSSYMLLQGRGCFCEEGSECDKWQKFIWLSYKFWNETCEIIFILLPPFWFLCSLFTFNFYVFQNVCPFNFWMNEVLILPSLSWDKE